jgi:hypothetical protein
MTETIQHEILQYKDRGGRREHTKDSLELFGASAKQVERGRPKSEWTNS